MVGQSLIETAAARDFRVFAISRRVDSGLGDRTVSWLTADLEGPLKAELPPADIWIHAAPLWLLPRHIPTLKSLGIQRIIAFSSTSAVTKTRSCIPAERMVAERLQSAELSCLQAGSHENVAVTLFRPTMIYGYSRDQNVSAIARFISKYGIFPIPRHALGLRQPVHVNDLVEASLAIVENVRTFGITYIVSGGEALTYKNMVARVYAGLGKAPRFVQIPTRVYRAIAQGISLATGSGYLNAGTVDRMSRNFNFSHQLATRDFDYHPASFLDNPARDLII